MTENRTIFEHTDLDGDRIQVESWLGTGGKLTSNVLLRVQDGTDAEFACVRLFPDQVLELTERLVAWYVVHGDTPISFGVGTSPQVRSDNWNADREPPENARCSRCGHRYGTHTMGTAGPCNDYQCACPHWNAPLSEPADPVPVLSPDPDLAMAANPTPRPGPDPYLVRLEALRLAVQRASVSGATVSALPLARQYEWFLRGETEPEPYPESEPSMCSLCGHMAHGPNLCGVRNLYSEDVCRCLGVGV